MQIKIGVAPCASLSQKDNDYVTNSVWFMSEFSRTQMRQVQLALSKTLNTQTPACSEFMNYIDTWIQSLDKAIPQVDV